MSRRADRSAPPRRGLFAGAARPPMDSMPRIRTAFARGLLGMWASPLVVGATVGWIVLEWFVILALGYPGPFSMLGHVSALPPLSTITDITISTGILGIRIGLLFTIAVGVVHALWLAVLTGWAVETIETGTATRWGAVRGLRAFPVTVALHVIGVAALFISQFVVSIGGPGLSLFLQIGVLVVVLWVLAFAPVIAVAEGRRLTDCLGRSVRAARLPGSGNVTFATLYVIPVFATLIAGVPGSKLDVSPPPSAWVFVILANLFHAAMLAAYAMRYLAVAGEVPDAPVRTPPSRDRSSRDRRPARRR
jgi:hypothetical protein